MIRYLGMGLVFLAVFSFSRYLDAGRSRRSAEEAALLRFLSALRRELSCYARPFSAFAASYEDATLEQVGFCTALRTEGTLKEAFERVRASLSISPPFASAIEGFAAAFGRGYREEELRALAATAAEAEAIYKKEEEDLPRRRRLSRTLCVSLSLAVVMLLL